MKRLVFIGLLALGTAIGSSAASAAPATTSIVGLSQTHNGIQLVRDRRHSRHYNRRHYRHHHYRGHRRGYNRYRGWHRYHHRPHGWRSRGCVIVGPVWFCP
jgi:Ni/Co efflux regulator RcnB